MTFLWAYWQYLKILFLYVGFKCTYLFQYFNYRQEKEDKRIEKLKKEAEDKNMEKSRKDEDKNNHEERNRLEMIWKKGVREVRFLIIFILELHHSKNWGTLNPPFQPYVIWKKNQ